MSAHGLDATFYDRHQFAPDRSDPVDRWCQLPQSGNRAAVGTLIEALELGTQGRLLLDPFCGAGSTLLAGAMRGRRVFGCDLEPLAAAISALKLTAPALAADVRAGGSMPPDTPTWRWAGRVVAAVDELGVDRRRALPKLLADCAPGRWGWAPGDHAVVCASAEGVLDLIVARAGGRPVDLFTSPPHGTGRSSVWEVADDTLTAAAIEAAPPPLVVSALAKGTPGGSGLASIARLFVDLRDRNFLGRVAVEFESSVDHPAAGEAMATVLDRVGLADVELVELYRGSPDGVPGVLGGGLVVGGG